MRIADGIYYGWFVLAASAVCELLVMGATAYASGLFVLPLQAEFHISRADANSSILILFLGGALMAPLVGKALDRYPIRLVVPVGVLLFSGAMAFIAVTGSLWLMALALLVPASIGFMAAGPLTTSTLTTRWFHRRRGLALGIAAIATSGGGLVVVPLLSRAIAAYGWRSGLLNEAIIIAAIVIALALLVLRDNPAAMGLESHPENQGRAGPAATRLRWHEILGRRDFWVPTLALANISGICQAMVVTVVPYGVQLGLPVTRAALFISAFALCAAVTKIIAGLLADRINQHLLILAATLIMMAGQLLLCVAPGPGTLLAASCLSGVSLGCALPTAAGLIAASFGAGAFGAVMGWAYALLQVFSIAATRFIGFVYDGGHNYMPAFATFLALSSCVFLVSLILAPPKHIAA
jgi:MFS family permease